MTRYIKGIEYQDAGAVDFCDDDVIITLQGSEYTQWVEAGKPAMEVEGPREELPTPPADDQ